MTERQKDRDEEKQEAARRGAPQKAAAKAPSEDVQTGKFREAKEVFAKTYVQTFAARFPDPTPAQQAQISYCYSYILEYGDVLFAMDHRGKVNPVDAEIRLFMGRMNRAMQEYLKEQDLSGQD